ncbi:hypothetical protein GCM10023195_27890 [Actinoallomurus liliacearum]|uniref:Uncharacterized protein n=1 Tax=Actinoallomurus liliacearum TaxID=1080073 RepID=A0ABP8TG07_9ACTN
MDEERVAQVDVAGPPRRVREGPVRGRRLDLGRDREHGHALLAVRLKDRRDVQVRADADAGGRILFPDLAEQERMSSARSFDRTFT